MLTLYDKNGKPRAALDIYEEKPQLSLSDENGTTRAKLGTSKDGSSLALFNEKGKLSATLGAIKDGDSGLIIMDKNEKIRAQITMDKEGPGLCLYDENEKTRAEMKVFKKAEKTLRDKNGKNNNVVADLLDRKAKVVNLVKEVSELSFYDENGNPRIRPMRAVPATQKERQDNMISRKD